MTFSEVLKRESENQTITILAPDTIEVVQYDPEEPDSDYQIKNWDSNIIAVRIKRIHFDIFNEVLFSDFQEHVPNGRSNLADRLTIEIPHYDYITLYSTLIYPVIVRKKNRFWRISYDDECELWRGKGFHAVLDDTDDTKNSHLN